MIAHILASARYARVLRLLDLERRMTVMENRFGEPQPDVHPAQKHLGDEVRGPDFFS